ncbi:unnamed protein product [Brassica oleracea]
MCRNIEENLEAFERSREVSRFYTRRIIAMFMLAVVIVILVVLPAVLPPLPPPPMFLMGIPVVLMLMLIYLAISYPPLGSSTCASSSYDTNSTDVK